MKPAEDGPILCRSNEQKNLYVKKDAKHIF